MPTSPVSATINLVGVPAIISAKEILELRRCIIERQWLLLMGCLLLILEEKKEYNVKGVQHLILWGVCLKSVRQGKSHYFYGGKNNDVLRKLRENLEHDYPNIQIVGMYSPPFRPLTEKEDQKVCEEINNLRPDFVWVGIGAPKQEMWMWEHQEKIHNTVMLGVGAGFDFFAGTLEKAPQWMEKASLEWLFRLVKEPKRFMEKIYTWWI